MCACVPGCRHQRNPLLGNSRPDTINFPPEHAPGCKCFCFHPPILCSSSPCSFCTGRWHAFEPPDWQWSYWRTTSSMRNGTFSTLSSFRLHLRLTTSPRLDCRIQNEFSSEGCCSRPASF